LLDGSPNPQVSYFILLSFFPLPNPFFVVDTHSAIIVTWFIVTISAIPVGVSHGIVEFYNHRNEINTACLFLTDEGYSHVAFQVSLLLGQGRWRRRKTNYL
jgi:hypothetical protein